MKNHKFFSTWHIWSFKYLHESFIGGNRLDTLYNIAKLEFQKLCFIHNSKYTNFKMYQQAVWIEMYNSQWDPPQIFILGIQSHLWMTMRLFGGLAHTVEGCWKGHRALCMACMWPVKNSQAWLPTQHLFSTLEFPWDGSLWRQGLCSQPVNGRDGCGKMALLRVGEVGSMMRRCNRSLRLSQQSAIRWQWRVRICYWTANPAL